ncbi:MAG: hypothetical protein LC130_36030 [Bryobacterales bacterium]|nr:hypothetical protein [Bryobacterales bacterium]
MDCVRSKDVVTAFLSCSVRPKDWPLVDALEAKVLRPLGFRCFTIGRNVSLPEQPDDAVRRLLSCCECLIGVATERLSATDRDTPEKTLTLATPYLLQETSMAFQAELPFLVFKTPEVTLLGVTNRNLWLEISPDLREGKVKFHVTRDQLYTALGDLKTKGLNRRAQTGREETKRAVGWLSAIAVGGYGLVQGLDRLMRPDCFGTFYYRDRECKACDHRDRCKVEKLERANRP